MCCRYLVDDSPELRPYIEAANRSPLTVSMTARLGKPLVVSGEVFPTNMAVTVAPGKDGTPRVFPMVWGFAAPRSGAPLINCRAETAGQKPLWKDAWNQRRCAVPIAWYFEWEHPAAPDGKAKKTGVKYRIRPREGGTAFLAGLYRFESAGDFRYPVFSVLTREPSEEIRFIHDRMPVIFTGEEAMEKWIGSEVPPEQTILQAVTGLRFEKAE